MVLTRGGWKEAGSRADRSIRKGIFAESVLFLRLVSVFSSAKLWLTPKSEGKLEKDIEILWIGKGYDYYALQLLHTLCLSSCDSG